MNSVLHLQALVLNFEKEILLSEYVGIRGRSLPRRVVLVLSEEFGDFALKASGKRD
jgi:hypothetical protein